LAAGRDDPDAWIAEGAGGNTRASREWLQGGCAFGKERFTGNMRISGDEPGSLCESGFLFLGNHEFI
jgi:hypothetical protein